MTIPVGIVGVTGYTGVELIRLIAQHPSFELVWATSRQQKGKKLGDIYPHIRGWYVEDIVISSPEEIDKLSKQCELAFLAVPHGAAMELAATLLKTGIKVVDLSADFRLSSPEVYEKWYNTPHKHQELLKDAVYGLIEIYKEQIKGAKLVANPGCYPTSIILGLYPALEKGFVDTSTPIIIDSKSGTSGAGRSAKLPIIFSEVYDNFRAYNIAGLHRHTPEIEEKLSNIAKQKINISFNPHLLPIQRGIISTMYVRLKNNIKYNTLLKAYREFEKENIWIRLCREALPETKNVRGTMYADISCIEDKRTSLLIIVSCIDNICRGASGQALANANLMCGLSLEEGLEGISNIP